MVLKELKGSGCTQLAYADFEELLSREQQLAQETDNEDKRQQPLLGPRLQVRLLYLHKASPWSQRYCSLRS